MKRLALYVFYDKDGEIKDFHSYYLKALKKVADVVVIANGILTPSSRKLLEDLKIEIYSRENQGFDFYAWKEFIKFRGYALISSYDELVLCNCSCYGPVYPFEDVFKKMDMVDCDFWGLYRHPEIRNLFPQHLQSYFLVLRQHLLKDSSFKRYWENLKPAISWKQAVNQEVLFTKYFEDFGFVSASFMGKNSSSLYDNSTIILPDKLLKNGFPLIKRKVFTENYSFLLSVSDGTQVQKVIDFVKNKTCYPIENIYQDLLTSLPNSKLKNVLHLNFVLPSENDYCQPLEKQDSVAIIIYSYFFDLIETDINYINSMPEQSHVFVVVVSEKLKQKWLLKRKDIKTEFFEVRIQENRGRNEAAYWLTCKDVINNFDYICLAHDKKTPSANPPVKGFYFGEHCWRNILFSKSYVSNIIALFKKHPKLGLLMPAIPMFAEWPDLILNREWAGDKQLAEQVYEKLNLKTPFDDHPNPPWGAMFWVRGKAMSSFYRYQWAASDFPKEPIALPDGTILHALERMYPMIVQDSGYFSGTIMPSQLAGNHYDNAFQKLLEYNKKLYYNFSDLHIDPTKIHFSTVKNICKLYLKRRFKILFKK